MKTSLAFLILFSTSLTVQKDSKRPVATTSALDPAATASRLKLPAGFRTQLIAGEPDVVQPIAYTLDDRGSGGTTSSSTCI